MRRRVEIELTKPERLWSLHLSERQSLRSLSLKNRIAGFQRLGIRQRARLLSRIAGDGAASHHARPPMIRIAISQAAFEAIASTMPLGSVGYESEANADQHVAITITLVFGGSVA